MPKKKIAITPAKLAANRANAQKSTGPRTPEGKAASRFNALTHGATACQLRQTMDRLGEDPAEYDRFRQGFLDSLPPATFLESYLIENMADTAWRLERLARSQHATLVVDVENRATELSGEGQTITDIQRDQCLGADESWKQTIRLEGQLSRHFERQFSMLAKLRKMRAAEAREAESREVAAVDAFPTVGFADWKDHGQESTDPGYPVEADRTGLDYVRIEPKPEQTGSSLEPASDNPQPKENPPERTQTMPEGFAIPQVSPPALPGVAIGEPNPGAWDLDRALPPGIPAHGMWKEL